MTKPELIQLVEKLIRQMPINKDLPLLKAGIMECFALPDEPAPPPTPKPKVTRAEYMRNYMRTYMREHRKKNANPFG